MKGKFLGVSFRDPPSIDLLDPHLSGLSNLGGHFCQIVWFQV